MDNNSDLDERAKASIINHMNGDHRDALALYLRAFTRSGQAEVADIAMTGIDATGIELSYSESGERKQVRITFADAGISTEVHSRAEARQTLVEMVGIATNRSN